MDQTTPFIYPGDDGAKLNPSSRYENFIGGEWQKPKSLKYQSGSEFRKLEVYWSDF